MYTKYELDTSGVSRNGELSNDAKKLYHALLRPDLETDSEGKIIAGNADLALFGNVKQSKISTILKELKAKGYIDVDYENRENWMGQIRRLRWITIL